MRALASQRKTTAALREPLHALANLRRLWQAPKNSASLSELWQTRADLSRPLQTIASPNKLQPTLASCARPWQTFARPSALQQTTADLSGLFQTLADLSGPLQTLASANRLSKLCQTSADLCKL